MNDLDQPQGFGAHREAIEAQVRLHLRLGDRDEGAAATDAVPFDLMLHEGLDHRHAPDATPVGALDGYTVQIMAEVDRMALRVGAILREAREAAPHQFRDWVDGCLPFGYETARRLMAISEAYERLPADLVAQLPRPWQALYALRVLPESALRAALESGGLGPGTSEQDAKAIARRWRTGNEGPLTSNARHHRADIAAGALMEFTPRDMNPMVLRALTRWLDRHNP